MYGVKMKQKYLLLILLLLIIGCANIQDEEYVVLEVKDIYLEYDDEGKIKCATSEGGDKVCINDSG